MNAGQARGVRTAQQPTESAAALSTALSSANAVLSQAAELPPSAQEGEGLLSAASSLGVSPFMNLGGNFSSATTALNQGFRTTYGASAPASFPPANHDEPQEQGAPAVAAVRDAQQLSPQQLQEQLAHLQRQQNLLQQLQQQQLQLQIVQQKQTHDQFRLHLLQQNGQSPQDSQSPNEGVSTAQMPLQVSHLPVGGAAASEPATGNRVDGSPDISLQLAQLRFSRECSSSNGDAGAAAGGFCF